MRVEFIYKVLFTLLLFFTAKILFFETNYYPENLGHIRHINTVEKEINYRLIKILNIRNSLRQCIENLLSICKFDLLNSHTFRILNYRLFNSHHIFGLYQYRILHELSDGSIVEPVKVFNEDLTPNQSSSLFSTRYLQALLYPVSDAVRASRKDPNFKMPRQLTDVFKALCDYSANKISGKNIAKHLIYVIPMDIPTTYIGSKKPWLKHEWMKFYEKDTNSSTINFHRVSFNDSSFFPLSDHCGFYYK